MHENFNIVGCEDIGISSKAQVLYFQSMAMISGNKCMGGVLLI